MKSDGQPRLFTRLSGEPLWAWAPDDDHAALIADPLQSPEIHIVSVKAESEIASVGDINELSRVAWSPDGEWLAWEDDRPQSVDIEVMRADGSDRRTLATGLPGTEYGDVFGWKDNNTLLASLWEGGINKPPFGIVPTEDDLFEFDLANGGQEHFPQPLEATRAELSRDASRIVFIVDGQAQCTGRPGLNLQVMDVSTGKLREVLPDTCGLFSAAWSPDGSEIAYGLQDEERPRGVYFLDIASGASHGLSVPTTMYYRVQGWSQDGSVVLAEQSDDASWEWSTEPEPLQLVAVPVSGGSETPISDNPYYALSPNGEAVALERDGLQVVQLPNGTARQVMAADPDWQLRLLEWAHSGSWSADGQWLAFARSRVTPAPAS